MLEAVLRLSFCRGIGPRLGKELLARFPDPAAIFAASPEALALPERAVAGLSDPHAAEAARREIREARRRGFSLVSCDLPAYPALLKHIADPPLVLRVWGSLPAENDAAFAIVGTRRATSYGRRQAARFSRELAQAGLVIVGGLARGIDSVAHEEALAAGGRTIAVLGSGLLEVYPPEHYDLARRISRSGAVISELPLNERPTSYHFPQRNRIIAGLSVGVLVVEGSARSGSMITAANAAEQGRLVFAVPGPVDSPHAEGVNSLLRDGASLAAKPEDILAELDTVVPLMKAVRPSPPPPALLGVERRILEVIPPGVADPEATAEKLSLPLAEVLAAFTSLELKGYLRRFGESLERLV